MRASKGLGGAVAALLMLIAFTATAGDRGTSRQAKLMLDNAVALLEAKGPKVAFAAFNDQQGVFIQNDLYIFAIDLQGKYFASGGNPALVGSSLAGVADAAGTPVGQEILTLAERMGHGLVEYEWLNRKTNDVEHKFTRIQRVGDYVLGVGFYLAESN